jgi:formylglycine-generating enzyme required for sulfatase activity
LADSPTDRNTAGSRTSLSWAARLVVFAVFSVSVVVLVSRSRSTSPGPAEVREAPDGSQLIFVFPGGEEMQFLRIPAGTFMMGSPRSEQGREDSEGPQREVTISKSFYMGMCEVTQGQYRSIMGENPSRFRGWRRPVEYVSWNDAVEFCRRLSGRTGRKVSLPTEAQWEYACRAGTTTRFSFGDGESLLPAYDWHHFNGGSSTKPVARKKPNPWGLYDMHGNVEEWCSDYYQPGYGGLGTVDPTGPVDGFKRVVRGGCAISTAKHCRSADRSIGVPRIGQVYVGFRMVVEILPDPLPWEERVQGVGQLRVGLNRDEVIELLGPPDEERALFEPRPKTGRRIGSTLFYLQDAAAGIGRGGEEIRVYLGRAVSSASGITSAASSTSGAG